MFIGNSKAAAHVACRLSVLVTVKPEMNERMDEFAILRLFGTK